MSPHPFETRLAESWPPEQWSDVTVLVAVSGGADSVALTRALTAIRQHGDGRLIATHFNHRWRGNESDADGRFVEELCTALGFECKIGHAAGPSHDEATARHDRQAFWSELAGQLGARFVVTAHTADDQAETVLHRVLRGTGITGLAGIPRARPLGPATLLRPLLHAWRRDVLEYLTAIEQPYCTDRTNLDTRFTRNRLRHELLPQLSAQYNSDASPALVRLGRLAAEAQAVLAELAENLAQQCKPEVVYGAFKFKATSLAGQPRYLVREMLIGLWRQADLPLREMSFDHWEALAELTQSAPQTAALSLPGGIEARRTGHQVTIAKGEGGA